MDTYENNMPQDETLITPQETENAYEAPAEAENVHETPVEPVKKVSPYADSPYIMNHVYEQPAKKKKKAAGKFWKRALCTVLILALVAGSCVITAGVVSEKWEDRLENVTDRFENRIDALEKKIESAAGNTGNSISGSPVVSVEGMTPGQVYAQNAQSVVMVYSQISTNMYGQTSTATSTGSGFVLTEDGYVVTNFHVIEGATKLTVQTGSGEEYSAEAVGYDSANDVALLKVDATGLQAVKIGSSNDLIVGDQVVAIGNPLGELTSTLTVGYISAKERDVSTDGTVINMLQTDAAINSGNSGGPLFNMKGEVVGITTAKYSGTSNSGATIEGIGFAIPIDDVYDMLDDLMNYGYVTGAYLGISVGDTDSQAAAYFGYPMGAYVYEVVDGHCAQKAGLKAKDVIVALGEYEIGGLNDLSRALRKFEPGDTTTIKVYRSGQEITMDITLDEKPQEVAEPSVPEQTPSVPEENMPSGGFDNFFDFFFGN